MKSVAAIILAAGKSTRLKSAIPKVLHHVCGRPVVEYAVNSAKMSGASQVVVVVGPEQKDTFKTLFGDDKNISFAVQREQLGTGDATRSAAKDVDKKADYTLIIPGDVPLIQGSTLTKLISETIDQKAVCGLLTMELADPASYGRVLRDASGGVKKIVEARDATPKELMVREVNSSIYCANTAWLFGALDKIKPQNAQKEYYLTDIIQIAVAESKKVVAVSVQDPFELMGVNTRKELAEANRLKRREILDGLMTAGVGILDEANTYIDSTVTVGADTTIYPNTFLLGRCVIGKNCMIENGVVLKNVSVGDNVHIKSYSYIEESVVGEGAVVGPFARLRPESCLEAKVKVGNFVEIKKSLIKKGAKANHLSYIGDAVVGERTNVGCGTITCNYDGRAKHKTVIGDDVFVGSDVQFIAPVTIGNGATIAAGSTITEDVPEKTLAIARARQVIKTNWKR